MKKYILGLMTAGFAFACQPAEKNNIDINDLQSEWKKTNEGAKAFSEKLDATIRDWEARYDNDSSVVADDNPTCQNIGKTYKEMQISVQSSMDVSTKESVEVERLSDELATENWTEQEENQLTSLQLAIDEKNAEIEHWEYSLDSLQKICPTPDIPIIEK